MRGNRKIDFRHSRGASHLSGSAADQRGMQWYSSEAYRQARREHERQQLAGAHEAAYVLLPVTGSGFRTAAGRSLVYSAEALQNVSHLLAEELRHSVAGADAGPGSGGRGIPRSTSLWQDRRLMSPGERMELGSSKIDP